MWDPTTNRFYYVMDSVLSASDNRLAFGFSKTASPTTISGADWCRYFIAYGSSFPDYPKLGDSRWFIIIGVNTFNPSFIGSDILAVSKPPAGTTCPSGASFKIGTKLDIRDSGSVRTSTPVPANQVDNNNTGYVVARNGGLPSTMLWFYNVRRDGTTGNPIIGNARGLTGSQLHRSAGRGTADIYATD